MQESARPTGSIRPFSSWAAAAAASSSWTQDISEMWETCKTCSYNVGRGRWDECRLSQAAKKVLVERRVTKNKSRSEAPAAACASLNFSCMIRLDVTCFNAGPNNCEMLGRVVKLIQVTGYMCQTRSNVGPLDQWWRLTSATQNPITSFT